MPRIHPFALTAWLLIGLPTAADAHAVGAEARLKGDRVEVDAYFDDDTPADDAAVVVTDAGGKNVAAGRTDARGQWSFPTPPGGEYKVAVDAGGGHRVTVALTVPAAPLGAGSVVSGGPTRAEFTGPMRFVWSAVGLAVIGVGTRAIRGLMRSGRRPTPTHGPVAPAAPGRESAR